MDRQSRELLANCQCFVYVEDAKVYQIDTPNMEPLQTILVEVAPVHFHTSALHSFFKEKQPKWFLNISWLCPIR